MPYKYNPAFLIPNQQLTEPSHPSPFIIHRQKQYTMESMQSWISEHKLTSIGAVWASAIGASLAYTRARAPYKTSVRLIHARMHAQALTLAVLSGAAIVHYYDKNHPSSQGDVKQTALVPN